MVLTLMARIKYTQQAVMIIMFLGMLLIQIIRLNGLLVAGLLITQQLADLLR